MKSPTEIQSTGETMIDYHYLKIVIVGESKVGKTTVLESLSGSGEIGRGYSIILDLPLEKDENAPTHLGRIYDLRSQRYFPYLHSIYYNNAAGAIVVFDVTRRKTFEAIKKWRDIIWGHEGNIPLLICGNKADLREDSEDHINYKEALLQCEILAENQPLTIPYIELSALQRIIAFSSIHMNKNVENIYPTVDAFREPFVDWIVNIVKNNTQK